MEIDNKIDIVIAWVDNSDPKWISDFEKYSKNKNVVRFEALGAFKYIFRGIDTFMPWVRKVHLVTNGHYPKWLNLNHPKLNMVNHTDIFPDINVLPTFNSRAIEMNLHFINDLSEQFIYFNDDMFVTKEISPKYFFTNNLPNDFFNVQSLIHCDNFSHALHSDMQIINNEIKKDGSSKRMMSNAISWNNSIKINIKNTLLMRLAGEIPLLTLNHHAQAHLKSNFIEVEKKYGTEMEKTRLNRFRSCEDINQYLFRFWGLIKGKYYPKKHKDSYYFGVADLELLKKEMEKLNYLKPALVCFNEHDGFPIEKYREYNNILTSYFNKILPEKSLWEKSESVILNQTEAVVLDQYNHPTDNLVLIKA